MPIGFGMKAQNGVLLRRVGANLLDTAIELTGGFLGSYFGMMLAALLESVKDSPAAQVQNSMWSGLGFGFLFWTVSLSFLNRVLIQGVSRASLGKKLFDLELISTADPITWNTMLGRWMMSFGSLAICGIGYVSAFLDKEGRTFHDRASHTDVVPQYQGSSMSVEYREIPRVVVPVFKAVPRNTFTLSPKMEDRPLAQVIQLPIEPKQFPLAPNKVSLAKVIDITSDRATSATGTDEDDGSGQEAA